MSVDRTGTLRLKSLCIMALRRKIKHDPFGAVVSLTVWVLGNLIRCILLPEGLELLSVDDDVTHP